MVIKSRITMNIQIIIWTLVALLSLAVLITRFSAVRYNRHDIRHKPRPRHRRINIIECGHEWEEFFVPGDRRIKDDYDYDEFDD